MPNVGKECKVKTPESKKNSLKSVALAVKQQHKNEVPNKEQSELNKCNQQWKHPKIFEEKKT